MKWSLEWEQNGLIFTSTVSILEKWSRRSISRLYHCAPIQFFALHNCRYQCSHVIWCNWSEAIDQGCIDQYCTPIWNSFCCVTANIYVYIVSIGCNDELSIQHKISCSFQQDTWNSFALHNYRYQCIHTIWCNNELNIQHKISKTLFIHPALLTGAYLGAAVCNMQVEPVSLVTYTPLDLNML